MTRDEMLKRWGSQWEIIDFILNAQVPRLDKERARYIMIAANLNNGQHLAQGRALDATRLVPGMEQQAVTASEDLRKAIWDVMWESSWADAWMLSWIIAQCGIGVSTLDMIGNASYTVDDYTVLVGPWLMGGFQDVPYPGKEVMIYLRLYLGHILSGIALGCVAAIAFILSTVLRDSALAREAFGILSTWTFILIVVGGLAGASAALVWLNPGQRKYHLAMHAERPSQRLK